MPNCSLFLLRQSKPTPTQPTNDSKTTCARFKTLPLANLLFELQGFFPTRHGVGIRHALFAPQVAKNLFAISDVFAGFAATRVGGQRNHHSGEIGRNVVNLSFFHDFLPRGRMDETHGENAICANRGRDAL